jgi:hypothetical protein
MSELLFGFRDLTNIRDPKREITFNIGSFLMNEEYVRKFNPKRYAFYIKFLTGLSNPSNLYKFLYKTNESKIYHEELSKKIAKVSAGLKKLSPSQVTKVIANLRLILKDGNNNNKYDDLLAAIDSNKNKFTTGGGGADTYRVDKPNLPMENLIYDVNTVYPLISKAPPKTIDDIVIHEMSNDLKSRTDDTGYEQSIKRTKELRTNRGIPDEKVAQIKNIYEKYKDISQFSPDRLKITFTDRCIFIGVTFLIRLVALSLVYWGLNSNLINNFKNAFVYYCLIYILFFTFIIGLVNIIFYYPIFELLGNSSINYIPNMFYFFYIHINGYRRLILHCIIILLLLFIPFVLSLDDNKKKYNNENINISYNYKMKDKIYKTISNFSLVIFVLTSIVAFNY